MRELEDLVCVCNGLEAVGDHQHGYVAELTAHGLLEQPMRVLLVIFMVTAKLDDQHALPLDLPEAASGSDAQRMLSVVLDADGRRSVDGQVIRDDAALRTLAEAMLKSYPELRTVIAASTRASHGAVIQLLDTLRLAGVDKVAFAVEPAQ